MATENFSSPHLSTGDLPEAGVDPTATDPAVPEPVLSEDDDDAPHGPLHISSSLDFADAIDGALLPGIAIRTLLTSVHRIAAGCKVVNDLLMQEYSDDPHRLPGDPRSPPVILSDFQRGQLQLMLSASWASLSRQAEHLADWAYEVHTEEGLRERIQRAEMHLGSFAERE